MSPANVRDGLPCQDGLPCPDSTLQWVSSPSAPFPNNDKIKSAKMSAPIPRQNLQTKSERRKNTRALTNLPLVHVGHLCAPRSMRLTSSDKGTRTAHALQINALSTEQRRSLQSWHHHAGVRSPSPRAATSYLRSTQSPPVRALGVRAARFDRRECSRVQGGRARCPAQHASTAREGEGRDGCVSNIRRRTIHHPPSPFLHLIHSLIASNSAEGSPGSGARRCAPVARRVGRRPSAQR